MQTHSAFLWFTLLTFGHEYAKPVRENLQRWWVGGVWLEGAGRGKGWRGVWRGRETRVAALLGVCAWEGSNLSSVFPLPLHSASIQPHAFPPLHPHTPPHPNPHPPTPPTHPPRYENCELRTITLSDGGGAGVPDLTWFPGGHASLEPQQDLMAE